MTSKSLFFKWMREDIRHRLWALALSFLAWFFIFPVRMALIPGDYEDFDGLMAKQQMAVRAEGWFALDNGFVIFVMLVGAILLGASSFSYLHSKKKVDFYHSLPVRRELLFAVNFLDGILLLFVPYLLCALAGAAQAMVFGARPAILFWNIAQSLGFHLVYYLLLYATVVIAMMMTGNLFLGLLGTGVFFFYVPMAAILIEGLFSTFFDSYVYGSVQTGWGNWISPVSAYFMSLENLPFRNVEGGSYPILPWGRLWMPLLCALLLIGFALWLYKKRPSEAAGRAMAFPLSKTPIKVLLVLLTSLGGCLIFAVIRDTLSWMLFGLLFTAVFVHSLIEILYHFDFRKLFAHLGQLACCLLVVCAIFFAFYLDLFGYDHYLPKSEELESAAISSYGQDSWVSYWFFQRNKEGELEQNWESNVYEYAKEHMFLEDKETALALAQIGVENLGKEREEEQEYIQVRFCYRLKSQKEVERQYRIPVDDAWEENYSKLADSAQFKDGKYPLLQQSSEDIYRMQVKFHEGRVYGKVEINEEDIAELLAVYQKDFYALTVEEQKEEVPIGSLSYLPVKDLGDRKVFEREQKERNDDWSQQIVEGDADNDVIPYPIYASFQNTIEWLKQHGVDESAERWQPDICRVTRWYDEENQMYSEPEQVEALYEAAVPNEYCYLNDWMEYNSDWEGEFEKQGETNRKQTYQFREDKLPEFLQ
ncbi:MAG: DUF6449 domain-containing protein [bacterium]|nr:DUF6449 domain-containing protein [bacterium]